MSTTRKTIAIIGRPNVGKSTLFNRLTGTRAALVSDLPGLTRDRKSGTAVIAGHELEIVDTAGLEKSGKGSIAYRMRSQSETALKSADMVLFVVDARDGVTPADLEFARIARQSGRPVLLVANKAESRKAEAGTLEAFGLGLGEPIAVSAEHGHGIGELEQAILEALGFQAFPPPGKSRRRKSLDATSDGVPEEIDPATETANSRPIGPIKVAIVGRPNAGKSTLVNALLGEERMITGPEPGLTRDSVATDTEWNGSAVRLWDTAGLRRKARIEERAEKLSASDAIRAIRFADVVVLLLDAERPLEQQDLIIGQRVTDEGRAIVVAINKWDLVADKTALLREIRDNVADKLAQVAGVAIVPLSARSGRGLDRLKTEVLKAYETWNRRIPTHKLNQWLEGALARHAPPLAKGRRIKLRYMTQPGIRPPTFVAFSSQAGRLPDDYVKYLTNSLRQAFDLPGTPIRFNLRKPDNPFVDKD